MGLELKLLSQDELFGAMAEQCGIGKEASQEGGLSTALIAGVLRRIATSTCPCPRDVIVGIAVDALHGLGELEAVRLDVRDVLDRLIIVGDLLELGGTSSGSVTADDWLYCAPPTFVAQERSVLILGVESEDKAAMPLSLRQQVRHLRELRALITDDVEMVREQLLDAGYQEVSRSAWTRLPLEQTSRKFLDSAIRRLDESGSSGSLDGLKVLGFEGGTRNFASRWTMPDGLSGYFVGRRPQAFGSPLWVFVELRKGQPTRFIDLPWRGGKFRGCDHGWRLRSALDVEGSRPQTYSVCPQGNDSLLYAFFSPLPLWAERRLRIHGERTPATGALIAYKIDCRSEQEIDDLLQSYMWFKRSTRE